MKKVFIDGKAGTTGLRIEERLSARDDIEIVTLPSINTFFILKTPLHTLTAL